MFHHWIARDLCLLLVFFRLYHTLQTIEKNICSMRSKRVARVAKSLGNRKCSLYLSRSVLKGALTPKTYLHILLEVQRPETKIGFSPKTILLVGNCSHPKLGTIVLIIFDFQGIGWKIKTGLVAAWNIHNLHVADMSQTHRMMFSCVFNNNIHVYRL